MVDCGMVCCCGGGVVCGCRKAAKGSSSTAGVGIIGVLAAIGAGETTGAKSSTVAVCAGVGVVADGMGEPNKSTGCDACNGCCGVVVGVKFGLS